MGPNTAFVMLMLGITAIYAELVWPGRILPGVVGLGCAVAGAYWLLRAPFAPLGMGLLAAGTMLLVAEALWGPYLLLGSLGTLALAAGFCLFGGERRISPVLAVPVSLVVGVSSTVLAASAKRARRNKRSDLGTGK